MADEVKDQQEKQEEQAPVVETPAATEKPVEQEAPAEKAKPAEKAEPVEKAEKKSAEKAKPAEKAEKKLAEKAKPAEKAKKDDKPAEKDAGKSAAKAEEKPPENGEEKKPEEGDSDSLSAKDLLQTTATPAKRVKIKGAKNVPLGIAHVTATFNNTVVSITDMRGAVISWSTGGRCGFKGSRKSTAYAATMVAQEAGRAAVGHGMHEIEIRVQGPGAGRESAIRALQAVGLNVTSIRDVTPIPHNGCRPPKRRRV